MTQVIVERHWEQPRTDADLLEMLENSAGCLARHRSDWHGSLLSADRRDLVCHFSGPDAESVRIALRQAGSIEFRAWAAKIHDAPGFTAADLARASVLVARRFTEPADFDAIQALEDAGKGCLDVHRVRFIRTYFSRDRKRMICLYEAPDAESVRIAQREATMPVERIWPFQRFTPESVKT
jgi:hypothetical protein